MATRRERMIDIVTGLGEAYRQAVSEATVNAYDLALGDLPIEAVAKAALAAMRTCKFMPNVSELRELATGIRHADRGVLAWDAVLSSTLNPYHHVDFDDGITNAVIRSLGGWVIFIERLGSSDGVKWARKEFIDTYDRLLSAGVSGAICGPLAGISQASVRDGKIVPPEVHRITTGLPPVVVEKPALPPPIVRPVLKSPPKA